MLVASISDPTNPNALSGVPHGALTALESVGCRVMAFSTDEHPTSGPELRDDHDKARQRNRAFQPRRALRRAKGWLSDRLMPASAAEAIRERARARSAALLGEIHRTSPDAVLVVSNSSPLFEIEAPCPLFYFGGGTSAQIHNTYPGYTDLPRGVVDGRLSVESEALQRVRVAAFATEEARRSAIEDHGVDASRVHTIPTGAIVVPDPDWSPDHSAPARSDLRLSFVGADPVRKRLNLGVAITEELCARGWGARLEAVGRPTPMATRSGVVDHRGRLQVAMERDRAELRSIYARNHILLMPTEADLFGITIAEAARFGRPCVATDLPEMRTPIAPGETGELVGTDAPVEAWADAVERLAADYERVSRRAYEHATTRFDWGVWARTLLAAGGFRVEDAGMKRAG